MPAAIVEPVLDQVRCEWASAPGTSANEVARQFQRKYGRALIRDRKIIQVVIDAKAQAPEDPFPCELWRPWTDSAKNVDDNFYLVELSQQKRSRYGVGLTCLEAEWAARLRTALRGLETCQAQELVRAYVAKERIAHYLQEPTYTEALDGLVVGQMWVNNENLQRYEAALIAGAAPIPFLPVSEAFLKELAAQGPEGLGADTWDRLNQHPVFERAFLILAGVRLNPGWSKIFLKYLRNPASFDALLDPAIADTTAARV
jgi:hypothetical protein